MFDWLSAWPVFAQEAQQKQDSNPLMMLAPFLVILAFFYILIIRPQRRDQAKRKDLLKALKKNDRVVTIGGIIGIIANVTSDEKEVTLKVDDNTRIKLLRSSIQSVLSDDDDDQKSK